MDKKIGPYVIHVEQVVLIDTTSQVTIHQYRKNMQGHTLLKDAVVTTD